MENEPSSFVEKYGGPVGGKHVQKNSLHLVPLGGREVVDEGVEQQRTDTVLAVLSVDAERQNVSYLCITAHGFRKNASILFVEFVVRFDFGHYQPNDTEIVHRGQGVESRAGRYVHVPR